MDTKKMEELKQAQKIAEILMELYLIEFPIKEAILIFNENIENNIRNRGTNKN